MNILITNDDGVTARGLVELRKKLLDLGHKVMVVAPDRNCSANSHSLTVRGAVIFKWAEADVVMVQGTPVDCMYLAMNGLLDFTPDLVISGINDGENLGDDALYSGTLAAATEAVLAGVPAIAVSLVYDGCMATALRVVEWALTNKIYLKYKLFNINIPAVLYDDLAGFLLTRQGFRNIGARSKIEILQLRGESGFFVGKPSVPLDACVNIKYDFGAIAKNFVSITPIDIDHTYKNIEELFEKFSCISNNALIGK